MPMERTFVILKPDAINRKLAGEIISRFERRNFTITNIKMMHITREIAEEHYRHVINEPIYVNLIDFMTSGPVIVIIIEGN
jgi:nucleoside-diphosphate kinase